MYRVLRHRFQVNWEQLLQCRPPPHDEDFIDMVSMFDKICISSIGFQNTKGVERGYFHESYFRDANVGDNHYLNHDPLHIPELTSTLLANLEPYVASEHTQETLKFRERLARLPGELKLLIFEHVTAAHDWPLSCTRLLGPRFWKTLFNKNNPCFAWLWDLDQEMVRQTDPDLVLDWELLFRKLSQGPKVADCFRGNSESDFEIFRGVLQRTPCGLEGRRRIWTLLEEMYIGDRSTRWRLWLQDPEYEARYNPVRDIEEVPVYWGRNGESFGCETLLAL
ncbi:hypothetical protein J7T55_015431 [Diaporthe amygdali]|uniref:uncharacterized protein n=1 Tax=Phomopsis amygdali TaxID=1214568 RepID=UPI0022FF2631|nr:uncharacterized protein J7T55_015431 [Diaporthe amygdali]KAJ0120699.1 hypothetical protein J7T55_015431 [Diaporthe amygdali]